MDRLSRERTMVVLTVIPVIVAIIGAGVLFYFSHRRNQEMAISDELRFEVANLRSTLTQLEKALEDLEHLPAIAGNRWEQQLINEITGVAEAAGVKVINFAYTVQVDEESPVLGIINFSLDVEGGEQSQIRCIALLQESVTGIKLETIDGMLGGDDSWLSKRFWNANLYNDKMKITGQVFFEAEDSFFETGDS